jgi:two-component system, OmpR family, response regulator MprA
VIVAANVLIVDDDGPVRRTLARTLGAEGYATVLASDGGAALAEVERQQPDVIVLDAIMPGLDGLAVARRLRAKGVSVPILMLTARDAVGDRVAGLDAGADDYLVKPFAVKELVVRVRALLRRAESDRGRVDPASAAHSSSNDHLSLTQRSLDSHQPLTRESECGGALDEQKVRREIHVSF